MVPYILPIHTGLLYIPTGTAQHASNALRNDHKKAIQLYHKTIDLENALKKKICDAIEDIYLDEL